MLPLCEMNPTGPAGQRVRRELELRGGVEDAEAVRPDEHRARCAHPLDDRRLALPALVALLAEPRRDRNQRPRSGGQRLVDGPLECARRHAQDHELGRLGQIGHAAMDRLPNSSPPLRPTRKTCGGVPPLIASRANQ